MYIKIVIIFAKILRGHYYKKIQNIYYLYYTTTIKFLTTIMLLQCLNVIFL
jgi:hypothetical protein